jgi:hypothetical protein
LAMLISRISLRTFGGTVGRPPPRLDFQRQYDLNPVPFYDGLRLHNRQSV